MKVAWWRHRRTNTAHAFNEEGRSLCLHAQMEDMKKRVYRGTMMRCKLCLKTLERIKKEEAKKTRRPWWRVK